MRSQAVGSKGGSERWLMLALIWFIYFCFGLVTASLAPLVTPIIADLALSDKQMGLVLGTWQLIYIGTAYPLGNLVDRLGVHRSVTAGVIIMGVSLAARAAATGFYTLFIAVALFGIGGPIISAGAPKLVSLWFRGRERGLASGIYSTAPVAGNTAALAIGGSLIIPLTGTWRGIGVVYGVVLLVALAAWLMLAKKPPAEGVPASRVGELDEPVRSPSRPDDIHSSSGWGTFKQLLAIRNVQLVMLLAVVTLLTTHGLNSWLPTYLHERSMTLAEAGLWSAGATAAGIAGGLLIPGLTGSGTRSRVLAAVLAFVGASLTGLVFLNGWGLILSVLLYGFIVRAIMPLAHVVLMETPGVGSRRMGAATGMYFTFGEVGGFAGPFLLGVAREATGSLAFGISSRGL